MQQGICLYCKKKLLLLIHKFLRRKILLSSRKHFRNHFLWGIVTRKVQLTIKHRRRWICHVTAESDLILEASIVIVHLFVDQAWPRPSPGHPSHLPILPDPIWFPAFVPLLASLRSLLLVSSIATRWPSALHLSTTPSRTRHTGAAQATPTDKTFHSRYRKPKLSCSKNTNSVFARTALSLPQTTLFRSFRFAICNPERSHWMRTPRITNGGPERARKRTLGEREGRSCKHRIRKMPETRQWFQSIFGIK